MLNKILISWILLGCGIPWVYGDLKNMHVKYQWKYIDYDFPSEEARQAAISNGQLNPANSVMVDVDSDGFSDRTFVTVKGLNSKYPVPATFCTVSNKTGEGGPLLQPYPNWKWYDQTRDCDRKLISVYKVTIDNCKYLWLFDTGVHAFPISRKCPPKFLLFDLRTNKLIERLTFPRRTYENPEIGTGVPELPVVTTFGRKCDMGAAYAGDPYAHALIVYTEFDGRGKFSRLNLLPFHYNSSHANIVVENETSFMYEYGLYSLAAGSGRLFFNSLTSLDLHETPEISIWLAHNPDHPIDYTTYPNLFSSQITALATVEEHEILFFALTTETAIGVWNYRQKNEIEIVEQDSTALQFISTLKVINKENKGLELMAVSTRLQKFIAGTVNFDEVNFRIMTGNVDKIINGTKAGSLSTCEKLGGEKRVREIYRSEDARTYYNDSDIEHEGNYNIIFDQGGIDP